MPRQARVVAVDLPHPITYCGNNRQDVFLSDEDRRRYQLLLSLHLRACRVDLIGWCWMTNHVHMIAVPRREDSLARLIRRVHSGYAQDFNRRTDAMVTFGEVVSIHALWTRATSTRRCYMWT